MGKVLNGSVERVWRKIFIPTKRKVFPFGTADTNRMDHCVGGNGQVVYLLIDRR
jgi:hypothetical protein